MRPYTREGALKRQTRKRAEEEAGMWKKKDVSENHSVPAQLITRDVPR